jgi:hypothetical protein
LDGRRSLAARISRPLKRHMVLIRLDALPALKGGDSACAASCGAPAASRFTGLRHRERWSYLASTGV